jgi:hypothetical protein
LSKKENQPNEENDRKSNLLLGIDLKGGDEKKKVQKEIREKGMLEHNDSSIT